MVGSHLVIAISNDQQRVEFVDATAEKLQQIQRSFVGPVNIFDDQDGSGVIL